MGYLSLRSAQSLFLKTEPIQLTVFLTSRCNARCRFCFYTTDRPHARRSEMGVDDYRRISSSMGALVWLAFSGGEIFLLDDLVEIVKTFYRANRPGVILLPTNGLEPGIIRAKAEEIARECKNSVVVVKLSLDGPEEVHDSLRGVEGAFRKTMETYEALYELLGRYDNFELGFNSVFCASSQDSMPWLTDFVKGLDGKTTHTVSMIRGETPSPAEKKIDIEKYRKTMAALASNLRNGSSRLFRFTLAGLKAAQDIVQGRLIYRTVTEQREVIPCLAGKLTLVLTETGDVYPCESFHKKIGNVHETGYDMRTILNTSRARDVIASIRNEGCHCTHECYMIMNILFQLRAYPSLMKEYARILFKRN